METHTLEMFIKLSENLNFSQTAKMMYTTQPTITKEIKALEKELGFTLFKRNNRSVELTNQGKLFAKTVKQFLINLNYSISRTQNLNTKKKLIIGYENNLITVKIIPKLLNKLNNFLPHIEPILQLEKYSTKNENLLQNNIDVLFSMKDDLSLNKNVKFNKLYECKLQVIISKKLSFNKKTITLDDIKNDHLYLLNPINVPYEMKLIQNEIKQYHSNNLTYVDNQLSACLMVQNNMGIAIMPDIIKNKDINCSAINLKDSRLTHSTVDFGIYSTISNTDKDIKSTVKLIKSLF